MLFVSVDKEIKRVAHTSGVILFIGEEPVNVPVLTHDPDTGTASGIKGLKECAMAAGCIPFNKEDRPPVPAADTAELDALKAELAALKAEMPAPVVPAPVAAPAKAKIVG